MVLWLSALRRISRNLDKPLRALEFLITHNATILTTNYMIRADDPISAYNHARNLVNGDPGCSRDKPCPRCPATTILIDTLADALHHLKSLGKAVDPIESVDIRVPSPLPRWAETSNT